MKKVQFRLYILALFFIPLLSIQAQIEFEDGYFINNDFEKVVCKIKNVDWHDNPISFIYKRSDQSEPQRLSIESVREFSIIGASKYIRDTVIIDRSSDNVKHLSEEANPIFNTEILFLKVLIEGKANLYEYVEGNFDRYFYSIDDAEIEQLIYKKYKTIDDKIGENSRFRQQLWVSFKCPGLDKKVFDKIEYVQSKLINLFKRYNNCIDQGSTNLVPDQNRDLFNLMIRSRANLSSFRYNKSSSGAIITDFGQKLGFGFGIEAEFILPFNKNKWGIIIEPGYQHYLAEKTGIDFTVPGGTFIAHIDYESIELPMGLRHYFFMSDRSTIFLDATYVLDFDLNSAIENRSIAGTLITEREIVSGSNLAFGLGFKHNRIGAELRYHARRELLGGWSAFYSKFTTISFILGYSLF